MEEIILKELIVKLTDQDKGLQAVREEIKAIPDHAPALQQMEQRIDGLSAEVEDIPKRIGLPDRALRELSQRLETHSRLLERPMQQDVRHHHHLSKPVWIAMALFACCVVVIGLLMDAWKETSRHEAADVKYRYLRVFYGAGMAKVLDDSDSTYISDPGKMGKWVEEQERIRDQETERLRQLQEEKEKVKELEKEGKVKRAGGSSLNENRAK